MQSWFVEMEEENVTSVENEEYVSFGKFQEYTAIPPGVAWINKNDEFSCHCKGNEGNILKRT